MKKLILLLVFVPLVSFGQDSSLASSEITYYGKDFFRLDNGDICHPSRFLHTISNKPISFSNSISSFI